MKYIARLLETRIRRLLGRDKSILLLGPRQTGKTTLMQRLKSDLFLSLVRPDIRLRYEKDPSLLIKEIEAIHSENPSRNPLVILDEVQKVIGLLDAVQDLIDRRRAKFILTGSSARKLRRGSDVNLLPGRVNALRLDPLTLREFPSRDLEDYLLYGSLPGICAVKSKQNKDIDLESYVTIYLEEEVRSEALVRNLGSFARFLEYAASESGHIVNLRKLAQEIGVSHTTIGSYYQILEDCLIAERIEPVTKSKTRKKLTKSQKYLFFDLGVRRLAAREGSELSKDTLGRLFEQFVGLELLRFARISARKIQIRFWRDPDGPEIDWIVEEDNTFVPVEVKWTNSPNTRDIRHLQIFLSEYPNASTGYLVCQTPHRLKLDKNIFALPWQDIEQLILSRKENGKG